MIELAGNTISKTHDHDIVNRIIDSFRDGLRTAVFQKIAEKNELAAVLQTYKVARDQGEILDLGIFLSENVVYSVVLRRKMSLPSKSPC